jgi:hypothetical protein
LFIRASGLRFPSASKSAGSGFGGGASEIGWIMLGKISFGFYLELLDFLQQKNIVLQQVPCFLWRALSWEDRVCLAFPVFCLSRSSVDGLPRAEGSMVRIRIFSQREK